METQGWFGLGLGIAFIIGAWTNILNYTGDPDELGDAVDTIGPFLFHFVFRKNRKAYRIFLYCAGIFFIVGSLTFCPALKEFVKTVYITLQFVASVG